MRAYGYLGTHEPSWLGKAGVPLFISHRRLSRLRRTLPKAIAPWGLDSGGFSEISLFGCWKTTPREYLSAVVKYDTQIGKLEIAAPLDVMCEPDMVAKTGLSVLDHQKMTVANYVELCKLWPDYSEETNPIFPVLQGYQIADYERCITMYADAGVDLSAVHLVGVGSVCRRQHTEEIGHVIEAILATDAGIPLHGFGCKTRGFMGWSYNARRNPKLPNCTHSKCSNCIEWALRWRRNIVGGAWCSRHGEWCQGFGGGYCGDFSAPDIGGGEAPAWVAHQPDTLAG